MKLPDHPEDVSSLLQYVGITARVISNKVVFVPIQVFLEASGKKVFRQTGFFTMYSDTHRPKPRQISMAFQEGGPIFK